LLELSRLESGISSSKFSEFNIGGLLDEIIDNVSFEASRQSVQIRYQGLSETLVYGY
jgi:signal transduction histidine kinase